MHEDLVKNNKGFIAILVLLELSILVFYRFFYQATRYDETGVPVTEQNNVAFYPMYQDVNVMMLIGFGFLMTFIKLGSWSALAYTFFINAIVVQYYLLWSNFWHKVMHGGWQSQTVFIRQQNFTAASYSVASVLIAFGAVLGRVGPYQLLVMAMIQLIAYTLNQVICYQLIRIYDVGGSTVIHTFGAYFGLAASFILALKKKPGPDVKAQSSKNSITFAMIGTLFLWMFWPSFNAGFFPQNSQQRSIIIINTVISLTGSCLGSFIITAFFRQKFDMEDILNASLAGGVIIGAPAGLFTNPAASLICGLLAGMISALGIIYLSGFLLKNIGLMDSCGVHNLHGIPGLLGGVLSAVAIAAYQSSPMNPSLGINLGFFSKTHEGRTLSTQAWYQILGTITSLGIGLLAGALAGLLMSFSYNFRNIHFFRDSAFFQTPEEDWLIEPADSTIIDPKSLKKINSHK